MPDKYDNLVDLTASIVASYVERNRVQADDLGALIASTYAALAKLGNFTQAPPAVRLVPAVSIRKSVTPEAIICLEDGLAFKSLKRHLSSRYDLTPVQYREKWSLPADYPMTAPEYSERRSAMAKRSGLGNFRATIPPKRREA